MLILASPQVSFTGMALAELVKSKVKIIFCDEKHNPMGEVVGHHDHYHSSKRIMTQAHWNDEIKDIVSAAILRQKICNQARLLSQIGQNEGARLLLGYADEILPADSTNREGHAAKVYFSLLFGMDFERHTVDGINAALDYGYALLLSGVNRAVVTNGYITQLGIHHCNEFNPFNLSCDLMEPFRPIVDAFVYDNKPPSSLDKEYKYKLVELLNKKVTYNHREYYLNDAIGLYVKNVLFAISEERPSDLILYEF